MKKSLKVCGMLMLTASLLFNTGNSYASASSVPYETYNYDYWGYITYTPAAYVPDGAITGESLGIGAFSSPQDFSIGGDGKLYIADTGNNRIVVLSSDFQTVEAQITGYVDDQGEEQTFSTPTGVCLSENGQLYIADTENQRVVELQENAQTGEFEFVKSIQDPQSEVFEEDFVFKPLKVTVDYADRVYVVGKNAFEGILAFDSQGNFTCYYGSIPTPTTIWNKIWRKLSTKTQRSKQQLNIPTEYTGVDIDESGFVYATYIDEDGQQAVMRLNPKGNDVINKKGTTGTLAGDQDFDEDSGTYKYDGASYIVDVVYRGKGIYSILDSNRGRIFTYDSEGNLLYIFGGLGTQIGTFSSATAIEYNGEDLLGLDSNRSEIFIFKPTDYGTLINEAVGLRYDGDETLAVEKWQQVLKYNENFELANVGIGKAYLTAGDNKNAMKYLKLGMSQKYYSIAYRRYRNAILKENLSYILTGIIVLVFAVLIGKKIYRHKKHIGMEEA